MAKTSRQRPGGHTGQRGVQTRHGVWRVVKGLMAAVGLDPRYATTCRHTFATFLYRASSADLEVVQEGLGHASVKTTTIYAKLTKEDKARAANALAKVYRDSQRYSAYPGVRIGTTIQGPGLSPGGVRRSGPGACE